MYFTLVDRGEADFAHTFVPMSSTVPFLLKKEGEIMT